MVQHVHQMRHEPDPLAGDPMAQVMQQHQQERQDRRGRLHPAEDAAGPERIDADCGEQVDSGQDFQHEHAVVAGILAQSDKVRFGKHAEQGHAQQRRRQYRQRCDPSKCDLMSKRLF